MKYRFHIKGLFRARFRLLSSILVALTPVGVFALELAAPFTDNAVLQRDKPVTVWGTAQPSGEVIVEFAGQKVTAKADANGNWRATLKPLAASAEPRALSVSSGAKSLTRDNILVGEVWMATGQSNMGWRVSASRPIDRDIAMTDEFDGIRILNVPKSHALEPQTTCDSGWVSSAQDKVTLRHHSGCAYFFARELHEKLKVPIGIIDPSFGGTHIDSWIAPDAWKLQPSLADTHKMRLAMAAD